MICKKQLSENQNCLCHQAVSSAKLQEDIFQTHLIPHSKHVILNAKHQSFFFFQTHIYLILISFHFIKNFNFFQISLRLSKIIWFWFHSISFKTFQLFSDFILNDTRTRQIFQTHCSAHWIEIQYLIQRYNILKLEILL